MNDDRNLPHERLRLKRSDCGLRELFINETPTIFIDTYRRPTHGDRRQIVPHMAVRGSRLLEEENQRVSDTKYETKQWKCNGDGRELCEGYREERLGPVQAVLVFEFLILWQHFSPLHRLLKEL